MILPPKTISDKGKSGYLAENGGPLITRNVQLYLKCTVDARNRNSQIKPVVCGKRGGSANGFVFSCANQRQGSVCCRAHPHKCRLFCSVEGKGSPQGGTAAGKRLQQHHRVFLPQEAVSLSLTETQSGPPGTRGPGNFKAQRRHGNRRNGSVRTKGKLLHAGSARKTAVVGRAVIKQIQLSVDDLQGTVYIPGFRITGGIVD